VSSPEPTAAERKLTARRTNEHLKLAASFLNTLALAIIGAAFVVPGVTSLELVRWIWIPVGLLLHLTAHLMLRLLKSEDRDERHGVDRLGRARDGASRRGLRVPARVAKLAQLRSALRARA
jgi:hypothetical protein